MTLPDRPCLWPECEELAARLTWADKIAIAKEARRAGAIMRGQNGLAAGSGPRLFCEPHLAAVKGTERPAR